MNKWEAVYVMWLGNSIKNLPERRYVIQQRRVMKEDTGKNKKQKTKNEKQKTISFN